MIYSLLGQAGYASLWDNTEETESSIVHFKKRIERTLQGITAIYPTLSAEFSTDLTKVSGEIYDAMLNAGCFYHTPYHIAISRKTIAQGTRCQFLRGHGMNEKRWISGIGSYKPKTGNDIADYPSFSDMFDFPTESLFHFWNRLIKDIRWNVLHQLPTVVIDEHNHIYPVSIHALQESKQGTLRPTQFHVVHHDQNLWFHSSS